MFRKATPFFIVCESPLHAGSGSDLGIVDLPIQRERHTDFPKIEGSSLKGGLREAFEQKLGATDSRILQAFGPENADYAGALGVTDARLLLFPVKSMKGVFAWITCPAVIGNFIRDLNLCQTTPPQTPPAIPWLDAIPSAVTAPYGCDLLLKENLAVLEEYTFEVTKEPAAGGPVTALANFVANRAFPTPSTENADTCGYWRAKMKKDILVLSNDDFRDFVSMSTEVITRTKISAKTGTVVDGALFTEEYLPAESILYSLALSSPLFVKDSEKADAFNGANPLEEAEKVKNFFCNTINEITVTQLAGNATIGKGIVRISAEV